MRPEGIIFVRLSHAGPSFIQIILDGGAYMELEVIQALNPEMWMLALYGF